MKLLRPGRSTSKVEIQGVSNHGIWLYVDGGEYFLSYKAFPWFLNATIEQIYNVELLFSFHLRWPDLDVDLELDALKHPARYPLVYSRGCRQDEVVCVKEKKSSVYRKKK